MFCEIFLINIDFSEFSKVFSFRGKNEYLSYNKNVFFKDRRSINMTVDNLRGHTCKFNQDGRENSMAQILKPTNMTMHYSQVRICVCSVCVVCMYV